MFVQQIALVSNSTALAQDELLEVSSAIQKQVTRDFGPIWGITATVDPFLSLEQVPLGYWRVIVVDDTGRWQPGIHETRDGKPYALVAYREDDWDTLASHEVLEMLADPTLSRRVVGDSPDPEQGRVEYLVEVCDPCQSHEYGYSVNGRWLSDFYTPAYFDPVAALGVRYSFQGSITQPRQILPGGYLSWRVPETGQWWMKTHFHGQEEIARLPDEAVPSGGNLRGPVDRYVNSIAKKPRITTTFRQTDRQLLKNRSAMRSEANALRAELETFDSIK